MVVVRCGGGGGGERCASATKMTTHTAATSAAAAAAAAAAEMRQHARRVDCNAAITLTRHDVSSQSVNVTSRDENINTTVTVYHVSDVHK